jgi:hypothetical protein
MQNPALKAAIQACVARLRPEQRVDLEAQVERCKKLVTPQPSLFRRLLPLLALLLVAFALLTALLQEVLPGLTIPLAMVLSSMILVCVGYLLSVFLASPKDREAE